MELYESFVSEGYPSAANETGGQLHTMFNWAMDFKRNYVTANPFTKLLEDDKAVERADIEDGRVLTADELRAFWFGCDDAESPATVSASCRW